MLLSAHVLTCGIPLDFGTGKSLITDVDFSDALSSCEFGVKSNSRFCSSSIVWRLVKGWGEDGSAVAGIIFLDFGGVGGVDISIVTLPIKFSAGEK